VRALAGTRSNARKVKLRLCDKFRPLMALGRHVGLFAKDAKHAPSEAPYGERPYSHDELKAGRLP
jgi:hypothetical protein